MPFISHLKCSRKGVLGGNGSQGAWTPGRGLPRLAVWPWASHSLSEQHKVRKIVVTLLAFGFGK